MNPASAALLRNAADRITARLLAELGPDGHWTGELSASALSTAVAVIALGELDRRTGTKDHDEHVHRGLAWLAAHANADGGWGDTPRSRSNLSTTALVWAAFGTTRPDAELEGTVNRGRRWIERTTAAAPDLVAAIEERYGDDRTFSVPIVMTLALTGRLGPEGWRRVRPLPFELAALPRGWFGALRLPVVSYALPALIALGQAIHHHAPSRNPAVRGLRRLVARRTLALLEHLQPSSGGFLEATPLTAFVTMALASMGEARHPVAVRAAEFLRRSVRPDGSWPIDTNLATWTTTLSIKALLSEAPAIPSVPPEPAGLPAHGAVALPRERLLTWLLNQQYREVHPYTGAAPGGWAWTDLPGGVPDADDTAGALLALRLLDEANPPRADMIRAATAGVTWLLDLQNSDGGIPTFCRGWGRLPFDRSAPELTAHALRAWRAWETHLPEPIRRRLAPARVRALGYLAASQRDDGSWLPLWFGNEHARDDGNPVFGTALVLLARVAESGSDPGLWSRAAAYLVACQNPDGSWGGEAGIPGSLEETGLAVTALARVPGGMEPASRGAEWLASQVIAGNHQAAPIGLYFARLWYHERLYPLLWTAGALASIRFTLPHHPAADPPGVDRVI